MRYQIMLGENFAGNIIINLASLPDFLRTPILKKRMIEFFALSEEEKDEVIGHALDAGPTIPFPNFAKLFKTWLEILALLSEEQRNELFRAYITASLESPQKLVEFNLDGILEIFLTLGAREKEIIAEAIRGIVGGLDREEKRKLLLMIPDNAKRHLGI